MDRNYVREHFEKFFNDNKPKSILNLARLDLDPILQNLS